MSKRGRLLVVMVLMWAATGCLIVLSCSKEHRPTAPAPCAPDTVLVAVHDTVWVDCDQEHEHGKGGGER